MSNAGGYLAVAQALRVQIADGALAPDGKLPSESDLATQHRVARTTVRRALKLLEAEGLITGQQGRGWLVGGSGAPRGPAFRSVLEDVRNQIEGGQLRAGDRLPSENDMAKVYRCSRGTIRRALLELEAAGHVETRPGVGRFVVHGRSGSTARSPRQGAW